MSTFTRFNALRKFCQSQTSTGLRGVSDDSNNGFCKTQISTGLGGRRQDNGGKRGFDSLLKQRTLGGISSALSTDTVDGVIGRECLWDGLNVIDATNSSPLNATYVIRIGIVQPAEMNHVCKLLFNYLASEAARIADEINASGECEIFFAEGDFPNDLYCLVRVRATIA